MKNVINKLKTLSKKQKVLVSLAFILVISTVVAINILNFTSPKQDMVSDTSLSSNKKDKDKSVDTEKEDTKEKKDTSSENTDKSQETTSENTNQENTNSVIESNTSNNVVSNNTNQSTNNTTSNNTSNNTNQSTNTTPPAQVCTGIYLDESSIGNSGLVFYSDNEYYNWAELMSANNGEELYKQYGKYSFRARGLNAVDSCGNQVSVNGWWTVIWTD